MLSIYFFITLTHILNSRLFIIKFCKVSNLKDNIPVNLKKTQNRRGLLRFQRTLISLPERLNATTDFSTASVTHIPGYNVGFRRFWINGMNPELTELSEMASNLMQVGSENRHAFLYQRRICKSHRLGSIHLPVLLFIDKVKKQLLSVVFTRHMLPSYRY